MNRIFQTIRKSLARLGGLEAAISCYGRELLDGYSCKFCGMTPQEADQTNQVSINIEDLNQLRIDIQGLPVFLLQDLKESLVEEERYEQASIVQKEIDKCEKY